MTKIVHFGDQQVFENATTYTCLLFLQKSKKEYFDYEKVFDLEKWQIGKGLTFGKIDASKENSPVWNFVTGHDSNLIEKMSNMPIKLQHIAKRIFQGFKTGADTVFILEKREKGMFFSKALNKELEIELKYLRPLFKSGDMKRYVLHNNSRFVIFPYSKGNLLRWDDLSSNAPKTADYLKACKEFLIRRENGKWSGSQWYCYSRNQALEIMSSPKILTADLNPFANYCIDLSGQACFPGGAAGGYGIVLEEKLYLYILGLLNSRAVDFFHKNISTNFRGGWFGYDAKIIRNIPIRTIDFSDKKDSELYDKMVIFVNKMISLHRKNLTTPFERESLLREIAATDRQIDALVYELYGLTEEEIKIVEGE